MPYSEETIFIVLSFIPAFFSLVLFIFTRSSERQRRNVGDSDVENIPAVISAWFQAVILHKSELRNYQKARQAVTLLGQDQIDSALDLIEQALRTNGSQWTILRRELARRRLEPPNEECEQRIQKAVTERINNLQPDLTGISEDLLYCAWNLSLAVPETSSAASASYSLGKSYVSLALISAEEKIRFDWSSAARDCFLYALEVFRTQNQKIDEIRTLNQLGGLFSRAANRMQGDTVNCFYLARYYYESALRACDDDTPYKLYTEIYDDFNKLKRETDII